MGTAAPPKGQKNGEMAGLEHALGRNHSGKEPSLGAESLKRTLEERLGKILGMKTHSGIHTGTHGHRDRDTHRDTRTRSWMFWSGCAGARSDFQWIFLAQGSWKVVQKVSFLLTMIQN